MIKNIPKKIYLVLGLDKDEIMPDEDFSDFENVSWCQNRISEADIEYVLSKPDVAVPIVEDKDKLWELINNWSDHPHPDSYKLIEDFVFYKSQSKPIEQTQNKNPKQ